MFRPRQYSVAVNIRVGSQGSSSHAAKPASSIYAFGACRAELCRTGQHFGLRVKAQSSYCLTKVSLLLLLDTPHFGFHAFPDLHWDLTAADKWCKCLAIGQLKAPRLAALVLSAAGAPQTPH